MGWNPIKDLKKRAKYLNPYTYAASELYERDQRRSGDEARRGADYDAGFTELGLRPLSSFTGPNASQEYAQWNMQRMSDLGFSDILPRSRVAPDIQFLANRAAAERNDRLMRQALASGRRDFSAARGALMSGVENMQTYRPGGAAAMASPYYQGIANTLMTQADFNLRGAAARRQEAPDLMFRYDEQVRKSAEKEAKRASTFGMLAGGATAIAGFASGNPLVGAGGLALTANAAQQQPDVPTAPSFATGGGIQGLEAGAGTPGVGTAPATVEGGVGVAPAQMGGAQTGYAMAGGAAFPGSGGVGAMPMGAGPTAVTSSTGAAGAPPPSTAVGGGGSAPAPGGGGGAAPAGPAGGPGGGGRPAPGAPGGPPVGQLGPDDMAQLYSLVYPDDELSPSAESLMRLGMIRAMDAPAMAAGGGIG